MGQSGSLVIWSSDRGLDYQAAIDRMTSYTLGRDDQSDDALWPVEHPAVFSLGLAAQRHHLLNTGPIPVVQTDRGGTGPYDVIMRAEAPSMEEFGRTILSKVQAVAGITRTLTCPVTY